jgi:hypothetical protein
MYSNNETFSKELYQGDVEGIVNFVNGPVKIHTCKCTNVPCTCGPLSNDEYRDIMSCLNSTKSVVKVHKNRKKIQKVHMFDEQPYLVVRSTDDPTVHVYKVKVLGQREHLDVVTKDWSKDEGEPLEVQYKDELKYIHTYHLKQNGREECKYAVQDDGGKSKESKESRNWTMREMWEWWIKWIMWIMWIMVIKWIMVIIRKVRTMWRKWTRK